MNASVIIPAFNAEKTIGKCLDSLAKQSVKGFETIVVDDGSKDGTARIVKGFPKVRLLEQKNSGPAVARNNGAKAAKGGIIIFTDSDCILEKDWLKEMLKPFEDNEIVGVQGKYKCNQKEIIARLIQLEIEKNHEKMARQKSIDFMATYSAAYRKSVFSEMNGFDTSFPIASGEDTDLSFRVSAKGYKMVFNPKAIVLHTHPASLKKYLKIKFFRAFWRTKVYKRHKGKMVKDSYTSQLIKVQVALFFFGFFLIVFSPIFPIYLSWAAVVFVVLLLTGIPFAASIFSKDKTVAILSPFIIVLRTAAFGFGLLAGTVRELLGK